MSKTREMAIDLANEEKYDEAMLLFIKAIEHGDKNAINDLGVLYERLHDYRKAFELYEISYKYNRVVSAFNIANFYENGLYVDKDLEKAVKYYKEAALNGYGLACFRLSELYRYGDGVEQDDKEAIKWLKIGMKFDVGCMAQLAYYYANGIGTKKNIKKYFKLTKKAASKGDALGLYNLGECYLDGDGCKINIDKAVYYLLCSAEKKYPDAYYKLGQIYGIEAYGRMDERLSNYYLWKAAEERSLKALLKCSRNFLEDNKKEYAVKYLVEFLKRVDKTYEYELSKYDKLKNDFKDDIDWDLLESDPSNYFNNISTIIS